MKQLWRSRYHRVHRRRRGRLIVLVLILLGAWFVFAKPHVTNAQMKPVLPALQPPKVEGETYWSGDATVEDGHVIDGDLVVYSGEVTVEDGGRVNGSLIDYSGDVTVEEGGLVTGDLTAWSGSVRVDGTINGSIAAWSGDISLGESAVIKGDVSAMSGSIEREDGTTVNGSVVQGPGFKWPGLVNPFSQFGVAQVTAPSAAAAPELPQAPRSPEVQLQVRNDPVNNPVRGFVAFVLRLFGAVFFSALAALLTALVFNVRPELVARIRRNLNEQPVYAAVAGAVINVPLLLVSGLLFVTFCLAPLALPPLLLLLVLNLIGVTGIAQIAGERLTKALNLKLEPLFVVGLGAFAVVGALSMLWAFGGCFRGIAWLVGFVGGSMGVGAFLMPWVKNFGNSASTFAGGTPSSPAPTPLAPVDVQIGGSSIPPTPPVSETQPSEAPAVDLSPAQVEEIASTPVQPEAEAVPAPVVETASESTAQAEPYQSIAMAATTADDFTAIKGIGQVLDRRLKEAGILTFAQLADLAPERMAEIFDRPLTWILEDDIPGQARYFASKQ
ncbi:MAG: polymer-forming cytoskeletal protein [Caldilineaceae bacterium]